MNKASYAEMIEKATQIHPHLVPRLNDDGYWYFVLSNPDELVLDDLSKNFEGTPAWEAFNTMDNSYGSDMLTQWGHSRGLGDYPVDVYAALYNVVMAQTQEYDNMVAALYPNGYPTGTEGIKKFKTLYDNITEKYAEQKREAQKIIRNYESTIIL